jgi:hypothetical protein
MNNILEPRLQKQVDLGISGTDILHGELKNLMLECEDIFNPLQKNSDELGPDEDLEDLLSRKYHEGYLDALTRVYVLTYELAFAIGARNEA